MLRININNGQILEVTQQEQNSAIRIDKFNKKGLEDSFHISPGDFTMLLNYYQYIKNKDIQCEFINPYGSKGNIKNTCEWAVIATCTAKNNGKTEEHKKIIATFDYPHLAQDYIDKCLPAKNREKFEVILI